MKQITIISGSLDALRATANHCRTANTSAIFVLSDLNDAPTALNILQDASIDAQTTVTLLLTPKTIQNEDSEALDPFFAVDDEVRKIDSAVLLEPYVPMERKPRIKKGKQTPEERKEMQRAYMKKWYQKHKEISQKRSKENYQKRKQTNIKMPHRGSEE